MCVCVGGLAPLTSRDLGLLLGRGVEGETQPAAADLQFHSLGLRGQTDREQQPVRVPGPELEAQRERAPRTARDGRCRRSRRRRCRERQETGAGAQEGGGSLLGLRAGEGHVALETRARQSAVSPCHPGSRDQLYLQYCLIKQA